MNKLVLRTLATGVTVFGAGALSKLISTQSQLTMNSVAVDQLRDSDSTFLQFTMLQWLMNSGWGNLVGFVSVAVILYFIWKGQFNVQK